LEGLKHRAGLAQLGAIQGVFGNRQDRVGSGAPKIARPGFPLPSKSFGTSAAAAAEFAALQRSWRDFRIAK
jgi:hypothetical protein